MGDDFNAWLIDVTTQFDDFLYTYILVILLVFCALYFTIRTKFVQIRYLKDMFTQLTEKKHVEGAKSISSFQAMMVPPPRASARATSPALPPPWRWAARVRSSGCG